MGILAKLFPPRRRKPAAPAPPAPVAPAVPATPVREYVPQAAAGGRVGGRFGGGWYGGRDLTDETWEMRRDYPAMLADDAVAAALNSLLGDIASQELQVVPRDPDDPAQQKVADFVYQATAEQDGGLAGMVRSVLFGAFVEKHSLSQIVLCKHKEPSGKWAGKQFVDRVKPKPPFTYDIRVDEYLNRVAVIPLGVGGAVGRRDPEELSLDGWIYYANDPVYGRPEGHSLLRAAHRYWLWKHRVLHLWVTFCEAKTSGLLVGEGAKATDTNAFFKILEEAVGGGALALGNENWKVHVEDLVKGGIDPLKAFVIFCNEAMTRAIRGAHLQQLEGQVQDGRGDSKVAAQQSDKSTWLRLRAVENEISRQFNGYVVRHNFAAGTPVPRSVLGDLDPRLSMVNFQMADMMRNLGLPLSRKQLYRMSPFSPPSGDPADVLPPPPVAPAPKPGGRDPALAGLYSEAGRGYPRELDRDIQAPPDVGGDGDGGGPPAHLFYDPSPTRDLPASLTGAAVAAKAAEVPEVADALATLEKHFGRAAVTDVTHGLPAPEPAVAPRPAARPRHVHLAEREAAARKRLAELEGSHDQEASFDRAQARHELALIDAERRGLAPPRFGEPHTFAGTAHKPPGTPEGGEFTSGPGGGGGSAAATRAHVPVGKGEHVRAAEIEKDVGRHVGGRWLEDNEPLDVRVSLPDGGEHAIEVKSLLKRAEQNISVHPDALLRKADYAAAHPGTTFHTVVVDERDKYGGGENAHNYSGHGLYYKRGSGKYGLASMHPVKDRAELRRLVNAPDAELPEKARGSLPSGEALTRLREQAVAAHASRLAKDRARKARLKAAKSGGQ